MVPNLPTSDLKRDIDRRLSFWRGLFARPNWLGESWKQEYMRRLRAVESSVRNAHDRINDLDLRKANRDNGTNPSA